MHLIDANVFLEAQLSQKNSDEAAEYLRQVSKGKHRARVTFHHVDAVAIRMETYGSSREKISSFYRSLRDYRGLELVRLDLSQRSEACKISDLDFDDGLVVTAFRELDADLLVSYESDFDDVDGIKRKEPPEVV
ncbi:MAG: type II toxin-antitoxin system VapC family toxin [Candidatus Nanohaloarchaea archaeon]